MIELKNISTLNIIGFESGKKNPAGISKKNYKLIKENKNSRYSISIDRIDNKKGYFIDNMQFVTHGYNSWKRNVRPIKVTYKGQDNYFFSAEEASRFYNTRRQSIGKILRGKSTTEKGYKAIHSTKEEVFKHHNIDSYKEYYEKIFK